MAKQTKKSKNQDCFDEKGYAVLLNDLKQRIRRSQVKAALAVNQELIQLYWHIGNEILRRQKEQGWGSKVIDRLSKDLRHEFPDGKGFSSRNLKYMRAFADAWPKQQFVHQAGAQIPWKHNCTILDKVKNQEERRWYIEETITNGWSRSVLTHQIDSGLYKRQGKAITNFEHTLPAPQSDLAQQIIKDPFNFEFLTIKKGAQERDLERGLVTHIRDFLLELGIGFAFLGSQYPLVVDDREFRLDLLFYHLTLRAYIIIDLKMKEFEPEFSGKMNFYVSAANHMLRTEEDNPTIGILLCRSQRKTIVEFSLNTIQNPIGVSTYKVQEKLPPDFQGKFPSAQQLEHEFEAAIQQIERNSN